MVRGQTDPALWRFVPPDAQALISIDWKTLRQSPLGTLLRDQLADMNPGAAMPGLQFLNDVDRVLISSQGRNPEAPGGEAPTLIVVRGHFNLADVRKVLADHGARPQAFNSFQVYRPQGRNARDMAFVLLDAETILIGDARSIFASLERSAAPAAADENSLLARAADMDSRYQIWALMSGVQALASDRLMGLLAGGDLGSVARAFEAGVSLHNGLSADIALRFLSEPEARSMASELSKIMKLAAKDKTAAAGLPELEKKLKITADGPNARISLRLSPQELERSARLFAEARRHAPAPVAEARPVLPPPSKPEKQVIRIEGLDDGPREIPIKPVRP